MVLQTTRNSTLPSPPSFHSLSFSALCSVISCMVLFWLFSVFTYACPREKRDLLQLSFRMSGTFSWWWVFSQPTAAWSITISLHFQLCWRTLAGLSQKKKFSRKQGQPMKHTSMQLEKTKIAFIHLDSTPSGWEVHRKLFTWIISRWRRLSCTVLHKCSSVPASELATSFIKENGSIWFSKAARNSLCSQLFSVWWTWWFLENGWPTGMSWERRKTNSHQVSLWLWLLCSLVVVSTISFQGTSHSGGHSCRTRPRSCKFV